MAEYRERVKIGDAAKDVVMITGGFVAGGFIGRKVEEWTVKTPVTPTSSTTDKLIAGTVNNGPKLALWYLLARVGLTGASAAMIGSAAYDILIRLTNEGVNPASIYVKGYRIMSNPKSEQVNTQINAMPFSNPEISEHQRKYGAMPFAPWSEKTRSQRKYGFAADPEMTAVFKTFGMH